MGRAKEVWMEQKEEEMREAKYQNRILEATHYILEENLSREDAYRKASELQSEREDPKNYTIINEEKHEISYLYDHLDEPDISITPQVKKIAEELYEKFNYDI